MSNSHEQIVETMARLIRIEEPFAPTTVVCTVAAAAAKPGAQALILSDGSMIGRVGGGCPRAAVERRRGAREVLGQTGAKRARSTRRAALADAIDH